MTGKDLERFFISQTKGEKEAVMSELRVIEEAKPSENNRGIKSHAEGETREDCCLDQDVTQGIGEASAQLAFLAEVCRLLSCRHDSTSDFADYSDKMRNREIWGGFQFTLEQVKERIDTRLHEIDPSW